MTPEFARRKIGLVESLRLIQDDKRVDWHARGTAESAADKIEQLQREIDYLYRCVAGGYNQGVFDFSILKDRALNHVRRADEQAPDVNGETLDQKEQAASRAWHEGEI